MKKYTCLFMLFLVGISCDVDNSDDVSTPEAQVNENNVIRANLGSFAFESVDTNTSASLSSTTFSISGGDGSSRIELSLLNYDGLGTYTLNTSGQEQSLQAVYRIPGQNEAPDRIWNGIPEETSTGQVLVTVVTETSIGGTFSFTGVSETEDDLTISNGSFKLNL